MATKITQKNIGKIRKEFEAMLDQFGEKYGLKGKMGNITFTSDSFRGKVTFESAEKVSNKPSRNEKFEQNWDLWYLKYGFKKNWLHKTFKLHNDEYEVVGINPRNTKNPLIAKKDGETYKMPNWVLTEDNIQA